MKKEIADRWIAELRSGKYPQGKYRLCSRAGYCCLGVLCDLARKEDVGHWEESTHGEQGYKSFLTGDLIRVDSTLPNAVVKWAEMDSRNSVMTNQSLSGMNDSGMSFEDIATYIEQNWKRL